MYHHNADQPASLLNAREKPSGTTTNQQALPPAKGMDAITMITDIVAGLDLGGEEETNNSNSDLVVELQPGERAKPF